jgi:hypothetical protein
MMQVSLAKDDNMIKTFLPDRANQPFHHTAKTEHLSDAA